MKERNGERRMSRTSTINRQELTQGLVQDRQVSLQSAVGQRCFHCLHCLLVTQTPNLSKDSSPDYFGGTRAIEEASGNLSIYQKDIISIHLLDQHICVIFTLYCFCQNAFHLVCFSFPSNPLFPRILTNIYQQFDYITN